MNNKKISSALKLSWLEASRYIGQLLNDILGEDIPIKCCVEDNSFWTAASETYLFGVEEINRLMQYADASDEETVTEAIPEDNEPTHSIGMRLSEKLLEKAINCSWESIFVSDECIWLCGIENPINLPKISEDIMFIGDIAIERKKLWTMDNVIGYLENSYSIYADLIDLTEEYVRNFGNELYWHYSFSDGAHSGVYFFIVQEGVLCLPYNEVSDVDGALFVLKDAKICSVKDMQYFIDELSKYAGSLIKTMQDLQTFVKELEADNNGK